MLESDNVRKNYDITYFVTSSKINSLLQRVTLGIRAECECHLSLKFCVKILYQV